MFVRVLSIVAISGLAAASSVQAQSIRSYVDENGVRVFTNLGTRRGGLAAPPVSTTVVQPYAAGNYSGLVAEMAGRYGLNAALVNAIIRVESDFDPWAVSDKNCKGLMQLHPDTARRFGVGDIFDPRENVEGGVKYLTFLNGEFGDNLDHVLAAYNAGEGAVRRYGGIPPYRETREYVRKIRRLVGPEASLTVSESPAARTIIKKVIETDGTVVLTNLPVAGSH